MKCNGNQNSNENVVVVVVKCRAAYDNEIVFVWVWHEFSKIRYKIDDLVEKRTYKTLVMICLFDGSVITSFERCIFAISFGWTNTNEFTCLWLIPRLLLTRTKQCVHNDFNDVQSNRHEEDNTPRANCLLLIERAKYNNNICPFYLMFAVANHNLHFHEWQHRRKLAWWFLRE